MLVFLVVYYRPCDHLNSLLQWVLSKPVDKIFGYKPKARLSSDSSISR